MLKFIFCSFVLVLFSAALISAQQPVNPCENAETKAFDFQIGVWQSEDSKQTHEIRKTLDGCAIQEIWKTGGKESAFGFKSFDGGSHHKTGEKKWFYSWFAKGFHQLWEGRKENGQWRFYRDWWLGGEAILSRTYWNRLPDGSLNRIVEQSRDGGKTWRSHVKDRFVKKTTNAASGSDVNYSKTSFVKSDLAGANPTQTMRTDFTELEKVIENELSATKTPGAAVAIIAGDKIVYAKGFGTTSAEGGGAVTADTLFRMGSTTKMFTAAALVGLAEAGKIKLNAPIGNYIKNLPPRIAALTAHQLLSQSSGLRDFNPLASGNDDAVLGQNIRLWKEDVFFTQPDKIYSYSSANYWLAGFLAEELSGKSYSDAMAEIIFKPLGMTRSTISPLIAMTYPLALGHAVQNGNAAVVRPIDNNVGKYPGGSMFSSANELARFAAAMISGGRIDGKQAIPLSVVEQLQKPQFYLPGEEKAFYGYGLLGFEQQGVKTVSHGGASRGYGSFITLAPEQKIAVIVLANTSGQTLPKTQQKAMEMLLPLKPSSNEQPKTIAINAEEMKRYTGKFTHAPQTWEILTKDGKLFLKENDKEFELKPTGKNEFSYNQGGILFVPNEKGEFEHIFMGLYAAKKVS